MNEYAKKDLAIWGDDFTHISNSYYVANYCINKGAKSTYIIHNPIRDEFYEKSFDIDEKSPIILLGTKTPKLLVFLLRLFLINYKVIQLRNMPFAQIIKLMSKSVVYADFGSNHGRDRMPREAAMLGCIVFTNTRGSFALKEDYSINKEYKIIDKPANFFAIVRSIKKAARNYEAQTLDFEPFREQLRNEKMNFDSNIKKVFDKLLRN